VLTYLGISRFGVSAEANPLVHWYALTLGAGPALVAAKLFAVGCGAMLYVRGMYRTIGVLTTIYAAAAVLPWLHLLWPGANHVWHVVLINW
jgi:hypothetical protein